MQHISPRVIMESVGYGLRGIRHCNRTSDLIIVVVSYSFLPVGCYFYFVCQSRSVNIICRLEVILVSFTLIRTSGNVSDSVIDISILRQNLILIVVHYDCSSIFQIVRIGYIARAHKLSASVEVKRGVVAAFDNRSDVILPSLSYVIVLVAEGLRVCCPNRKWQYMPRA